MMKYFIILFLTVTTPAMYSQTPLMESMATEWGIESTTPPEAALKIFEELLEIVKESPEKAIAAIGLGEIMAVGGIAAVGTAAGAATGALAYKAAVKELYLGLFQNALLDNRIIKEGIKEAFLNLELETRLTLQGAKELERQEVLNTLNRTIEPDELAKHLKSYLQNQKRFTDKFISVFVDHFIYWFKLNRNTWLSSNFPVWPENFVALSKSELQTRLITAVSLNIIDPFFTNMRKLPDRLSTWRALAKEVLLRCISLRLAAPTINTPVPRWVNRVSPSLASKLGSIGTMALSIVITPTDISDYDLRREIEKDPTQLLAWDYPKSKGVIYGLIACSSVECATAREKLALILYALKENTASADNNATMSDEQNVCEAVATKEDGSKGGRAI